MPSTPRRSEPKTRWLDIVSVAVLLICFVIMVTAVYWRLPITRPFAGSPDTGPGIDWRRGLRPFVLKLLHGQSPYDGGAYNPWWALAALGPIAVLPAPLGCAVLYVLNIWGFTWTAVRLRMPAFLIAPFLVMCGPLWNANNGNIDGLVGIGFVLPAPAAMFFLLAKPQIGFVAAIYLAIDAGRGGWRSLARTVLPVAGALLAAIVVFGAWFTRTPLNAHWNVSIWPFGVPVGLALLAVAVRRRDIVFAMAAGPLLSPYVGASGSTWAFVWLGALVLVGRAFETEPRRAEISAVGT